MAVHAFGKDIRNLCNGMVKGDSDTEIENVTCATCKVKWNRVRRIVVQWANLEADIGLDTLTSLYYRILKRESEL